MDSENIFINEYNFNEGNHTLEINNGFIHSFLLWMETLHFKRII